jgi:hypothetical protein
MYPVYTLSPHFPKIHSNDTVPIYTQTFWMVSSVLSLYLNDKTLWITTNCEYNHCIVPPFSPIFLEYKFDEMCIISWRHWFSVFKNQRGTASPCFSGPVCFSPPRGWNRSLGNKCCPHRYGVCSILGDTCFSYVPLTRWNQFVNLVALQNFFLILQTILMSLSLGFPEIPVLLTLCVEKGI